MNLLWMLVADMVRRQRRRGRTAQPIVLDLTPLVGRVPPGRN